MKFRGEIPSSVLSGSPAQEEVYRNPYSLADNPTQEGVIPGWFVDGMNGEMYDPARHGVITFKILDADGETIYHGDNPSDDLLSDLGTTLRIYWTMPNFELGEN